MFHTPQCAWKPIITLLILTYRVLSHSMIMTQKVSITANMSSWSLSSSATISFTYFTLLLALKHMYTSHHSPTNIEKDPVSKMGIFFTITPDVSNGDAWQHGQNHCSFSSFDKRWCRYPTTWSMQAMISYHTTQPCDFPWTAIPHWEYEKFTRERPISSAINNTNVKAKTTNKTQYDQMNEMNVS